MNRASSDALPRKKQGERRPSKAASPLRAVFGRNVRLTRIAQHQSLHDIAAKAEIDWSYLGQIERGERSVGLDLMDALAQALELELFELLRPDYEQNLTTDLNFQADNNEVSAPTQP